MDTSRIASNHGDAATNRLWGTTEVAKYLGVPNSTLYQWRIKGYGPQGRRIGRYVKYKPQDVRDWVDKQPEGNM